MVWHDGLVQQFDTRVSDEFGTTVKDETTIWDDCLGRRFGKAGWDHGLGKWFGTNIRFWATV